MKTVYILGAPDHEMAAIEAMLRERGLPYMYAAADGRRVHGGNAYRADDVIIPPHLQPDMVRLPQMPDYDTAGMPQQACEVVTVECDVHSITGRTDLYLVSRVDHHRLGDPGYGRPPEAFFAASSIGQMYQRLHCGYFTSWTDGERWYYHTPDASIEVGGADCWTAVPESDVLTAAADHCLEAAYAGQCPGVSRDELLAYRLRLAAQLRHDSRCPECMGNGPAVDGLDVGCHLDLTIEQHELQVKEAFARASRILESAITKTHSYAHPDPTKGFWEEGDDAWTYRAEYADLRGHHRIDMLPEAACYHRIPYLARVREPSGREKIVLQAAPQGSDLIPRFLAGQIVPDLVEHYGDPARGFAGGYTRSLS